jgi:hypothetical protein
MKKNSGRFGWLLIGLLLLILLVLFIASLITDSESVKNYRDEIKSKADKLKHDIINQKGMVAKIKMELHNIRHKQGYLVNKARKICMAVKCVGLFLLCGMVVMVHSIFSLNPIEFIITFCTMSTLIYGAITGVILNEVRGINDVLRLLQEAITQKTFARHNFEPTLIEVLEQKLSAEEQKLNAMKAEYNNLLTPTKK